MVKPLGQLLLLMVSPTHVTVTAPPQLLLPASIGGLVICDEEWTETESLCASAPPPPITAPATVALSTRMPRSGARKMPGTFAPELMTMPPPLPFMFHSTLPAVRPPARLIWTPLRVRVRALRAS